MISNKQKQNIEVCVVKIECINILDDTDKEFGTGFFINDNTIATATHVINKYYSNPDDYIINVIPIKAKDDNKIKVRRVIENKRNNYISILEIEESVKINTPLIFTNGYDIKRDDDYYTFGYPICKKGTGYAIENKISTNITDLQSKKVDWELGLTNERAETFQGLSGAPVIIDNMLVGIIQTESTSNGKGLAMGMSTTSIMKEYIPDEYYKEYSRLEHIKNSEQAKLNEIYSVEDIESHLNQAINPPIGLDFFEIDDKEFKDQFKQKISDKIGNIFITGKSREESLYCILNELKYILNCSNVIIVNRKDSWEKLRDNVVDAILIPNFYSAELVAIKGNINIFIYGEDEHCTNENKIELRRRLRRTIISKLEKAGLSSKDAYNYVKNTNGLFIPLKRKLFNGQYNVLPSWVNGINESFVIALLCGKWSECDGDKKIIEGLIDKPYDEFINDLTPYTKGSDPFIIEINSYNQKKYQLANMEMAWEILDNYITKNIWNKFEALSYKVITKIDPIFYKPFEEHYRASLFVDKPENSNELKLGMIRSMIFRGVYRNGKYQYEVDSLVKKVLDTLDTLSQWGYLSQFFTELCEASPKAVIDRLEKEIKEPTGLRELFSSNYGDTILGRHYYVNILWAVEHLLLYKTYVFRAIKWLFEIDDMDIKYSISNSPKNVLQDVFCTWFNVSVLKMKEKIAILNRMINKYKNTWYLIYNELPGNHRCISNGNRPNYRKIDDIDDTTNGDMYELNRAYIQLCIDSINNHIDRWEKIIEILSHIPDSIFYDIISNLEVNIKNMDDNYRCKIKDKIRMKIYKHRYFSESEWSMEAERIEKLETLVKSIDFENQVYDYLYLFNYSNDLPILNPIPYNEEFSSRNENEVLKEKEIELGIKKFKLCNLSLTNLLELSDKGKHNNLGCYIAKYYTESKFENDIYREMLKVSGIENVIISYVSWLYNNSDNLVIEKAKVLSKGYENKNELYVNLLKIQDINYIDSPYIMNEDEEIKKLYWSSYIRKFSIIENKETYRYCLDELKKYDNIASYIEILYSGLGFFNGEELIRYMNNLMDFKVNKSAEYMDKYYLNKIIEIIQIRFDGQIEKYEEIMSIELFLRSIMKWEDMKCTQYIFKENPIFYAQMIDIIYLHEGEIRGSKSADKDHLYSSIYELYYKSLFCPCEKDGDVDLNNLRIWINKFRDMLKNQKQINLFGSVLGRLFAYSPIGKDGYFPHESIREMIEEISDEDLINSYVISESNKRGVYSPNAGITEKEMSLKYKENADAIRLFYSETAKIYDRLYENYAHQSISARMREEDRID